MTFRKGPVASVPGPLPRVAVSRLAGVGPGSIALTGIRQSADGASQAACATLGRLSPSTINGSRTPSG